MPDVTTTRTGHTMGVWGKGHTMQVPGSGVGILKRCIHTLLTLTRGHSTTLRDATLKPRTRSTWSLYSLYSRDALTLTPSSRSTDTARFSRVFFRLKILARHYPHFLDVVKVVQLQRASKSSPPLPRVRSRLLLMAHGQIVLRL